MTRVKFYVERDGSIFAYFPDMLFDGISDARVCYAHVGQHSSCVPSYLPHRKLATPEQYKDLLEELKSQGYTDLKVVDGRHHKNKKKIPDR